MLRLAMSRHTSSKSTPYHWAVVAMTNMRRFKREEDGAFIIFGVMMFGLMLAIGGISFDIMRFEAHRERLQSTLDRAVLAAASLSQKGSTGLAATDAERKLIVIDYLTKAGMEDFISLDDIDVVSGFGSSRVTAKARIHVPLHHGDFLAFSNEDLGPGHQDNVLIAEAASAAQESIGNVEISMVLDVSGSMQGSRLSNLKDAAKGFLDTVYDIAEDGKVTTSIIPYATQVNAGATLLSYLNLDDQHDRSHCLNFSASDYTTSYITPSSASGSPVYYEQTLEFDYDTNEYDTGWDVGEALWTPGCESNSSRVIMPLSTNKNSLKTYIDGFVADGWTSIEIGAKWGAALLDPAFQPVVTAMSAPGGSLDSSVDGRPFNYTDSDAMKILILMTDGANTYSYSMDDYRDGDSFVWKYAVGNDVYYSMWHDGEGSTPDPTLNSSTQTTTTWEWVEICRKWAWWGCKKWVWDRQPVTTTQTVEELNWFVAYNTAVNSGGDTQFMWKPTPYDGDNDETDAGVNATRMTWDEVWAEIPPEYFSDYILAEMETLTSTERNAFENSISEKQPSTKNTDMAAICSAVKANNVIVFTIGMEVTQSNATRLSNCASTVSHYYDVDNLDIDNAFQSIAAQINQLRLIQ